MTKVDCYRRWLNRSNIAHQRVSEVLKVLRLAEWWYKKEPAEKQAALVTKWNQTFAAARSVYESIVHDVPEMKWDRGRIIK